MNTFKVMGTAVNVIIIHSFHCVLVAMQRWIQQFKKGGSFTKVLDKRVEKLKMTTPTFSQPSASYK